MMKIDGARAPWPFLKGLIHDDRLLNERPNLKDLLERYYSRPAFRRMIEANGT